MNRHLEHITFTTFSSECDVDIKSTHTFYATKYKILNDN